MRLVRRSISSRSTRPHRRRPRQSPAYDEELARRFQEGFDVEAYASGYRRIARYNDNPYAQLWFEKPLEDGASHVPR